MNDEDARWVEALAGRDDGSAPLEARRLREGILARAVEPIEAIPAHDAAREAELVARARREGLLPVATRFWDARRVVATLAVAASLALAFILFPRHPKETDVTRGERGGIVHLAAEDPGALQRAILRELAEVGVAATGYERLGRFGIDADLPPGPPAEVADVLRRHGLPVPSDGVLTVEIALPAAR